ncbi:MAG TPA: ABC transporter permease [Baekduia sp.]|uniref:ABC transporter permease n=1 Tax=Baekduia sp. TaxID=2600305 RepID=UPI002D79EC71|nr:ABC transporter permease [Baekduia sp.]HET6508158.1 ABC transporter permease [Baekduia sp.]
MSAQQLHRPAAASAAAGEGGGSDGPGTGAAGTRARRVRSFAPRYPGWLAGPLLAYYLVLFVAPLLILVAFALARQADSFAGNQIIYGFYTDAFSQVFDSLYLNVFKQTFLMAFGGTAATVLVGFPLAYWMARHVSAKRKGIVVLLVIIPFWTSFLIRTFAWKIILDGDGSFAGKLHLDILYTWKAVLIGLVYGYLPLFVLPAYAALERMDWTLVDGALDLGATPWRAFKDITLPLTRPGLLSGTLLVFIPMAGEYVIPEMLGGGRFLFVGNVIQGQFIGASNWPFGSAVSLALMGLLSIFVILYLISAMREEQFGA